MIIMGFRHSHSGARARLVRRPPAPHPSRAVRSTGSRPCAIGCRLLLQYTGDMSRPCGCPRSLGSRWRTRVTPPDLENFRNLRSAPSAAAINLAAASALGRRPRPWYAIALAQRRRRRKPFPYSAAAGAAASAAGGGARLTPIIPNRAPKPTSLWSPFLFQMSSISLVTVAALATFLVAPL